MRSSAYIPVFVIIGLASMLLLLKYCSEERCQDFSVQFKPDSILVGDDVTFSLVEPVLSDSIMWAINDAPLSGSKQALSHVFERAGNYKISVFPNDRQDCGQEFFVQVKENPTEPKPVEMGTIEGPTKGEIGQRLTFSIGGIEGEEFAWSFGESGGEIEAEGKRVSYTYQTVGKYTLRVLLDNQVRATHTVRISNPNRCRTISTSEFASKLNETTTANRNYIEGALAGGPSTPLTDGGNATTFRTFFNGLRVVPRKFSTSQVRFQTNSQGCITSITIN